MRFQLILISLTFFSMCSTVTPERKSMENVMLSTIGLQKAYLDTARTGVKLEFHYSDPWLKDRDSIRFFLGELDDNFDPVFGYDELKMKRHSDTAMKAFVHLTFDHLELPVGVLYEVGAFYLVPPQNSDNSEWEIDTLINEYFVFHVYDDPKAYQAIVDSLGLDPTVILRE